MFKILVVEDSKDYQLIIKTVLEPLFAITICETGAEAIQKINSEDFDLALIDIVIPDMSGLQICNYIKTLKSAKHTSVILVTSKDTIEDKSKGFDCGADDYLTKPFHHKELLMRINARLRNNETHKAEQVSVPGLEIEISKQRVIRLSDMKSLDLTRSEFKLLLCFVQRVDHLLSRQQILDLVWPTNLNISERTVDSHISNLRKKLLGVDVEISAVHGSGYRFNYYKKVA
ncbi:MAG: response regulator transcription factor [Pseudobdellovibrio sp.]